MLRYAAALHAVAVLADDDTGGESKKAGPIALLVILLLAIACFFLFRSMSKHLRRVRDGFPTDDPPPKASPPNAARNAEPKQDSPAGDADPSNVNDAPT
jgi:hypothetical protein